MDYTELQKGLIITDDVSIKPILDFNLYKDAIKRIITKSFPKFTIGIFGDWGTGKTTLMNTIDKDLREENNIITVRFESWRYEREDQFALIPLLKTIAFAFPENEEKYQPLKQKLKRGATNVLKKMPDILLPSLAGKFLGDKAEEITENMINSFRGEFNKKVELLAEVDRDTLYFDGFEDIGNEIKNLRQREPDFRIVVFVDDLDRCSPMKTLEVLESIKVFLGMEGFIYILGLSHDIISKLIDLAYEKSGVTGEHYIKKIIQIPINLPKWNDKDIKNLINYLLEEGIVEDNYKKIIKDNIDLILLATEQNPREIKRFLNNFIVAFEIFSTMPNFNPKELLIVQALQLRWNNFYNLIIKSEKYLIDELKKYVKYNDEERLKLLELDDNEEEKNKDHDLRIRKILRNFKTDSDLWLFLTKNINILTKINDWSIYRRATETGNVFPSIIQDANAEALELLQKEKIVEFNKKREEEKQFANLHLEDCNLERHNLRKAKLGNIYFEAANFNHAKLNNTYIEGSYIRSSSFEYADLSEADLEKNRIEASNFNHADLRGINLKGSIIKDTNLEEAKITQADLEQSILIGCYFKYTNLMGTNLINSIIIDPKLYDKAILDNHINFENAVIDDPEFINYIGRSTLHLPKKIKNKRELKEKLKDRSLSEGLISICLNRSKLPDD